MEVPASSESVSASGGGSALTESSAEMRPTRAMRTKPLQVCGLAASPVTKVAAQRFCRVASPLAVILPLPVLRVPGIPLSACSKHQAAIRHLDSALTSDRPLTWNTMKHQRRLQLPGSDVHRLF